jgi:hypothetical protein
LINNQSEWRLKGSEFGALNCRGLATTALGDRMAPHFALLAPHQDNNLAMKSE